MKGAGNPLDGVDEAVEGDARLGAELEEVLRRSVTDINERVREDTAAEATGCGAKARDAVLEAKIGIGMVIADDGVSSIWAGGTFLSR